MAYRFFPHLFSKGYPSSSVGKMAVDLHKDLAIFGAVAGGTLGVGSGVFKTINEDYPGKTKFGALTTLPSNCFENGVAGTVLGAGFGLAFPYLIISTTLMGPPLGYYYRKMDRQDYYKFIVENTLFDEFGGVRASRSLTKTKDNEHKSTKP